MGFKFKFRLHLQECLEVRGTVMDCVERLERSYMFHITTVLEMPKLGKLGMDFCHGVPMLFADCSIYENWCKWQSGIQPVNVFSFNQAF